MQKVKTDNKSLFSLLLLIVFLTSFFMAGCSYLFPKKGDPNIFDLFTTGQDKLALKKYKDAQEAFQKVLDETSDNELRIYALINLGDSFLNNEEFEEAKFQYQKFLELYPAHELAVRAQYQIGMCDFLRMKVSSRDQGFTKDAIASFEKVVANYPSSSPYVKDAQIKMAFALSKLAEHDLLVGKFYHKQKQYHAAIFRFNNLLKKYPEVDFVDEVLYYLGDSYYQEQSFENAKAVYEKLLSRHPKSRFAKTAKARLKIIK